MLRGASAADKQQPAGPAAPPDVGLYCDPTLAPAMRQLGTLFQARTQVPVAVFSAPPMQMLALIEHDAQDDVLMTLADAMDDAVRHKLVKPETRFDGWRNRLVFAARAGDVSSVPTIDPDSLTHLLGSGRIAVTDPTVAAAFDGPAVLDRLGLTPTVSGKVVGAANTGDVAFLVKSGAARLGLLYLTDVRATPALAVTATLDPSVASLTYSSAITKKAKSPNSQAFLNFLRTPAAAQLLRAQGLEILHEPLPT